MTDNFEVQRRTTIDYDFDKDNVLYETDVGNRFQSIVCRLGFESMSFEELRVNDYASVEAGIDSTFNSVTLDSRHHPSQVDYLGPKLRRMNESIIPMSGVPVFVRVGKESLRSSIFILHRELLIGRSEYFKAALKGEWKTKETDETMLVLTTIDLDDDDPAIFSIYAEWLHSGVICSMSAGSQQYDTEFKTLVRAYILGDKLVDRGFKNTIIDAFIEKIHSDRRFDLELPRLIYDNTPCQSPLRRLLVDIYVWQVTPSWMCGAGMKQHSHPDFVLDTKAAAELARCRGTSYPWADLEPGCFYHDHDDTHSSLLCLRRKMGTIFQPRARPVDHFAPDESGMVE